MTDLKPWYAIAHPHKDVRDGRLDESVFAANLWAVAQDTGAEIYRDPVEFFKKSYITEGLRTVIRRVANGLSGKIDSGDRVISLQTSFGGGKTHTLVSLWHIAKNGAVIKKANGKLGLEKEVLDLIPDKVKGVAVFTNQTCNAATGRQTPEGVKTHTLWGEIALQLGGKALYEKIRVNDEQRAVPQGLFVEVLKAASPCLILLDEMADYCVGAAAVNVNQTTLADQTISFIQQLSEAVSEVPGAVVVATLPASALEVAQSEKGQEAFSVLEKRFGRMASDMRPVADHEIYDVVRTRLFESVHANDNDAYISKLAQTYFDMMASHSGEVPAESSKSAFKTQLERSFPFHPTVIDTLYTRWGSHPDFQRTRGVLRLLANIIGDLWQRRNANTETQHMIQPCHVRWSIDALQAQLTRLWGPTFQSVAASDVIGAKSNAALLDAERGADYLSEHISEGLASAILLGSFGGKADKAGFTAKDLKMCCAKAGVNWNYLDGALLGLEDKCHYLHFIPSGSSGKRYWFSTKPNVNKLVVQYRQDRARETFDDEIIAALRDERESARGAATWSVVTEPQADMPEKRSLTLAILTPSIAWGETPDSQKDVKSFVMKLSLSCGSKDRTFRNTLLFLAPSVKGLSKLRQIYRERSALSAVLKDYSDQLDEIEKSDLKKRLDESEVQRREFLCATYSTLLRVHGQEVEVLNLQDTKRSFTDHLAFAWDTLIDEEWIIRRVGTITLKNAGLVPTSGGISIKEACDAFLRYTDKPMIAAKEAVADGVAIACREGQIGIGRGTSLEALTSRYCREGITVDVTDEGTWIIPAFTPQHAEPASGSTAAANGGSTAPGTTGTTPAASGETPSGEPSAPGTKTALRKVRIHGHVPVENWTQLFTSFISPAVKMQAKVQIGFDIEIKPGNPSVTSDDQRIKSFKESARQLGLEFESEE